jgi:hypothetical protein
VLAGSRHTWLGFASAGTRANTPPADNGAGNSLTTGSGTAMNSALGWHRLAAWLTLCDQPWTRVARAMPPYLRGRAVVRHGRVGRAELVVLFAAGA